MKKTISISIANTLFYIEEDAYADLEKYLRSVREHFASYLERDEIVADIESRISERFSERTNKIVSKEDVTALIAAMGDVEDFDDAKNTSEKSEQQDSRGSASPDRRKLFRDTDEAVIGGVAAGLAAYMGLDVLIVRLIFVISIFFGGTGIIVYIILWLVMPEALTATEKLQMKGSPVTLESVKQVVEDKVDEVRLHARQGRFKKFGTGIERLFAAIGRFFSRGVFPIVGKIIGFFIAFVSTAAFIGLAIAFFSALFNYPDQNIDFPFGETLTGALYYGMLISGFLTFIIPVVLIFMLALSLIRSRNAYASRFVLPLAGVWLIAAVAFGVSTVRASALHTAFVRTNPSYQSATASFDVGAFTSLDVNDRESVRLVQATTTRVTAEGRQRDLDDLDIVVRDGVLSISQRENTKICIFCSHDRVTVTVAAPSLQSIRLRNGSRIESVGTIAFQRLDLDLANVSDAELELSLADDAQVTLSNGSHAKLSGSANSLQATVENASSLEALPFQVQNGSIEASNGSDVEVNALQTLDITAENGSSVYYEGAPALTRSVRNGSHIDTRSATTTDPYGDFNMRYDEDSR